MRFGFPISISGGFDKVLERVVERKCQAIQIFSRNPRGWGFSPLDENEALKFSTDRKRAGVGKLSKSVESLAEELRRAHLLGARYVVYFLLRIQRDKGLRLGQRLRNWQMSWVRLRTS